MTARSDEEMVTYALEIDSELLAFAPELLADLDVLGSDAALIVEALRHVGVSERSTVVDLGSGKGGVAIAIAAALGCPVLGIELFEPFIDLSRAAAENAGVAELCRFMHGNITGLADTIEPADAVVYAALGDVLGTLDVTIAAIRGYAKKGGYVVVNDCYLPNGATGTFPGFENYTDLVETRRRLTACGDDIVLELHEASADDRHEADDTDEASLIAARAAELAARHPHLASAFHDFARAQQDEYDYLDEHVSGAVWVVRRR